MKLLFSLFILTMSVGESFSWAMVTLKKIQIQSGTEIKLTFDGKVAKDQISSESLNDFIQINLRNVSVYPAKIISMEGNDLVKVFAYQYSPKLVRCRLFVEGTAERFKDRVLIHPDGKIVSIKLEPVTVAPGASVAPNSLAEIDENALLEKIKQEKSPKAGNPPSVPVEEKKVEKKGIGEKPILAGGKLFPSFTSVLLKLAGVVALLLFVLVALGRFRNSRYAKAFTRVNWVGFFSGKRLEKKDPLIQVISSHYLDAKKSIRIVRISGQRFVLGVTADSINLITQLEDDDEDEREAEKVKESSAGIFSQILDSESEKSTLPHLDSSFPSDSSVRSRIRSRLKEFKPL